MFLTSKFMTIMTITGTTTRTRLVIIPIITGSATRTRRVIITILTSISSITSTHEYFYDSDYELGGPSHPVNVV